MNIFTLPLKNIRRKILRTFIILFIFSLGVISVVSIYRVSKIVSMSLEDKLNRFGANIIIKPKSEILNISYGGVHLGDVFYNVKYLPVSEMTDKIRNIRYKNNISVIAPKLIVVEEINGTRFGVVGVDFVEELKIKRYWETDGSIPKGEKELLIGSEAANRLKKDIGDKLFFLGENFVISGIIDKTGSEDDFLIFTDLKYLQKKANLVDKANFIEVSALCSGCPIEDIVLELENTFSDVEVNAIQKIVKQRMSAIHFVEHLAYSVISIIILTSCFMIGLFIFNSVNERKKEIGILRSMGYSKSNIFFIFSFEGIFIGFIASFVGYIAGFYASNIILKYLNIENRGSTFSFSEMALLILSVLILTIVSSSYPSYKGSKIEPADTIITL